MDEDTDDINESDTDFKVVYTHPAGDKRVPRAEKVKDPCGPQVRFGLGAVWRNEPTAGRALSNEPTKPQ